MTVKTEANKEAESFWTIDLFIERLPTRVRASRDAIDGSSRARGLELIRVHKI
jgi:hypothetical protein